MKWKHWQFNLCFFQTLLERNFCIKQNIFNQREGVLYLGRVSATVGKGGSEEGEALRLRFPIICWKSILYARIPGNQAEDAG